MEEEEEHKVIAQAIVNRMGGGDYPWSFAEEMKVQEIFRPADAGAAAPPWWTELNPDEQHYIEVFNDTTNTGQTFCYLRSIFKAKGMYEAVAVCTNYAMLNGGSAELRGFISRRHFAVEARDMISVLILPKVQVKSVLLKKLGMKFTKCKDFFGHSSSRFRYPKSRFCTDEYMAQVLGGVKRLCARDNLHSVNVPRFPELDFEVCVEKWGHYPLVALTLPDMDQQSKTFDREFFFDVVNTVYPRSMTLLLETIRHKRVEREVLEEEAYQEYVPEMEEYLRSVSDLPAGIESRLGSQRKKKKKASHYEAIVVVEGKEFEVSVESEDEEERM
jgi:hypothetical protein